MVVKNPEYGEHMTQAAGDIMMTAHELAEQYELAVQSGTRESIAFPVDGDAWPRGQFTRSLTLGVAAYAPAERVEISRRRLDAEAVGETGIWRKYIWLTLWGDGPSRLSHSYVRWADL